jgi:type IV fimbrial biogenesis protein FimT
MKARTSSGFSLLELMIVVVIGGILAVLALPSFRTYLANSNISQTANGTMAAFNTARAEAIKRNAYVRVDPTSCGTASWAFGSFVWAPNSPTDTLPTANTDTRIVTGTATGGGSDCNSGKKITATPSTATWVVCYNGSGRANLNIASAACSASVTAAITSAEASTNSYTIKFCDAQNAVPKGDNLILSLSGRTSIQPNIACP